MARALPRMDLTPQERRELDRIVRADTSEQRAVLRARIVLLADDRCSTQEIMDMVGVSKPVVVKWRSRFVEYRLEGLRDAPGRGRPRTHGPDIRLRIATEACRPPEGVTHWSTRDLAEHIGGVSHVTVHRVLAAENSSPNLASCAEGENRLASGPAQRTMTIGLHMANGSLPNHRDIDGRNSAGER